VETEAPCAAKWLKRQGVVVGWTERKDRGVISVRSCGYYTNDGKFIYAGRASTGMPDALQVGHQERCVGIFVGRNIFNLSLSVVFQ
jgi:ATP-dependent DNA ligase